jgi:hypothetical protein
VKKEHENKHGGMKKHGMAHGKSMGKKEPGFGAKLGKHAGKVNIEGPHGK